MECGWGSAGEASRLSGVLLQEMEVYYIGKYAVGNTVYHHMDCTLPVGSSKKAKFSLCLTKQHVIKT